MDEFTQSHSLEVISLASKCITRDICRRLSDLNYLYSVKNYGNHQLEQFEGRGNIFVIHFSNTSLQKPPQPLTHNKIPCLTIFCDPEPVLDHPILQRSEDFCIWPCQVHELEMRLKKVWAKSCHYLCGSTKSVGDQEKDVKLIGNCPEFLKIKQLIQKCAGCDAPVLIEGETGTGKEVLARAIHSLSSRRDYPFVPVNCGALPDSLMENEFFGHEKGAYTDAKYQQGGLISQADGGTLFLDEVECLSPKGQASLLRFTENQEYKPLGSKHHLKSNVRIITASNVPFPELIAQDRFRQDLYFRLNLISLALPALRNRGQDIEVLAEYFMQQFRLRYGQLNRRLDQKTLEWMQHYSWPGNIRELENYIHRLFLLNDEASIVDAPNQLEKDRPFVERRKKPDRRQAMDFNCSFKAAKNKTVNSFEECYLKNLIAKTHGNVTMAAKMAAMERRAFGKLLKKHGINKEKYIT